MVYQPRTLVAAPLRPAQTTILVRLSMHGRSKLLTALNRGTLALAHGKRGQLPIGPAINSGNATMVPGPDDAPFSFWAILLATLQTANPEPVSLLALLQRANHTRLQ
jgi:hypothetical protein